MRRALPRPLAPDSGRYLALLDRRLDVLAELAAGRPGALERLPRARRDRDIARRFLAPLAASWDDGDENLVRGFLDRWLRRGEEPSRAAASSLLEAAEALARMRTRPETLWFFLWEMESILGGIARSPRA